MLQVLLPNCQIENNCIIIRRGVGIELDIAGLDWAIKSVGLWL